MVLEHHQNLLPNGGGSLQPALQLYAAAAAQLAPRARVPPWAPFLQFGMPNVFGSPFMTRPRFGPVPGSNGQSGGAPPGLAGLTGLAGGGNGGIGGNCMSNGHPLLGGNRTMQGPPSEDSNEDRGRLSLLL